MGTRLRSLKKKEKGQGGRGHIYIYIYLEVSKDTELEKCLHGKTQNAKESFIGTIWERIPKNTFVTLPDLEFAGSVCCSTLQY